MIVILRTGERLTVHRLNDEVGAVEPRPGERVILHWDAAHSYVIGTPEPGSGSAAPGGAGVGERRRAADLNRRRGEGR